MKNPTIKNRIAYYNLAGAATLVLIIFILIYRIVWVGVVYEVNRDLEYEIDKHTTFVANQSQFEKIAEDKEWREADHNSADVNPVFVEIFDKNGNYLRKSNNLKKFHLVLHHKKDTTHYVDAKIGSLDIRQMQAPLINNGDLEGYVVIAMSISEHYSVLQSLRTVLIVGYPLVLFVLFFLTRFIAGRSLKPVFTMITATKAISDSNLNARIGLPKKQDELFTLATAINEFLGRIERAVEREKQFTSHASHELRTPLAVIKGTLEVLVRKPRTIPEYEDKIRYCINEVNRLTTIADQLLILTRFESSKEVVKLKQVALDELILETLERNSTEIARKNISIDFKIENHFPVVSDVFMTGVIIDNIVGNAIKYSADNGTVTVRLVAGNNGVSCIVTDSGIGIAANDLRNVFEQFFRSEVEEHTEIQGTGLGLAIVKRYCDILNVQLTIDSTKGEGTTVVLLFPAG